MSLVIDTSIAVKWLFEEEGSGQARALLSGGETLVAPDLLAVEFANAAWKLARTGKASPSHAEIAVATLPTMIAHFHSSVPLAAAALDLARRLDHPVYDCLYLALAQFLGARLVTADRKLAARLEGSDLAPLVEVLA